MSKDKNTAIIITAIFLILIAIAIYFLFIREEEDYKPPDLPDNGNGNGGDPPPGPGMDIIRLNKVTSYSKKIKLELGGSYYGTMLSGQVRPGGSVYTNIKIYYSKSGSRTKLGTVGGWPGGSINFAYAISDYCDLIIFEAEQGIATPRYVDEVHAQLMVEVG